MIDTKTEGAITMFASMSAGVVNVPSVLPPPAPYVA